MFKIKNSKNNEKKTKKKKNYFKINYIHKLYKKLK